MAENSSHNYSRIQRPVIEQIEELKAKLALLEGDRKAYYESCFQTLHQCKKKVFDLRDGNNDIRHQMSEKLCLDQQIINQAFQNRPIERTTFQNKSGPEALVGMDHLVCDSMKKLNALRHMTSCKRKRLDDLKTHCESMKKVTVDFEATMAGINHDGQQMRDLENRIDKSVLKCNEADHIRKTYQRIKEKLEEEHMTFGRTLDSMEAEVNRCEKERRELQKIYKDASYSRTMAQNELRRHEELVYGERKRRDLEMTALRKEAEDKRLATAKIEKKLNEDDLMDLDNHQTDGDFPKTTVWEPHNEKVKIYEEIFRQLREVTGVYQLSEVIVRFEGQVKTLMELESIQKTSELNVLELRKDQNRLREKYDEREFFCENGVLQNTNELKILKEEIDHKNNEIKNVDEKISTLLSLLLKYGIALDHVVNKTTSVTYHRASTIPKDIEDYPEAILNEVSTIEQRGLKLIARLSIYDVDREYLKKMSQESEVLYIPSEYHYAIENKLNTNNPRVKYIKNQTKDNVYDEDDDSGDEVEVLTRYSLKKQSKLLIEQKQKKQKIKKKIKKK